MEDDEVLDDVNNHDRRRPMLKSVSCPLTLSLIPFALTNP